MGEGLTFQLVQRLQKSPISVISPSDRKKDLEMAVDCSLPHLGETAVYLRAPSAEFVCGTEVLSKDFQPWQHFFEHRNETSLNIKDSRT